jgi:hypothetical protein
MARPIKIAILDQFGHNKNNLYKPWINSLEQEVIFLLDYDSKYSFSDDIDLVITAQHYEEPEVGLIQKAVKQDIPTLILADGILEFNNIWCNPKMSAGRIFQPVLGHKIAVLGRSQTRILESWGNIGKCEIVGLPRLDQYLDKQPRIRKPGESFKILVMTGKTPGYTTEQIEKVTQALLDLKNWFEQNTIFKGLSLEPLWRIASSIAQQIEVDSQISDLSGQELSETLQEVDALITAPSTSVLEGMLQGIPVSLLNYGNTPQFVPAAWSITCFQHIADVIDGLIQKPATYMLFQDTILHDSLECRTPSIPRLHKLILEMVELARGSKKQHGALLFPDKILCGRDAEFHFPEQRFNMKTLYPDHPIFGEMDTLKLQIEIEHLKRWQSQSEDKVNVLRKQVRDLEGYIEGIQSSRFWKLREKWLSIKSYLNLPR